MTLRARQICLAVEWARHLILNAESYLWRHPATGYFETEASSYLEKAFVSLGYTAVSAENIPGFYADFETGRPGPKVLVLAELDALALPEHPDAVSGAVHSCGHHAQCASILGIAAAVRTAEVYQALSGSIRFMLVPAEELIEVSRRRALKDAGIITHFLGKTEFLSRGYLNGVDMAFLFHTGTLTDCEFFYKAGSNGAIAKEIVFTGKSAHAGAFPHRGVNALAAATLGLDAIGLIRDTFSDEARIRVHSIITNGGSSVNSVPAKVEMESFVRGASLGDMINANDNVNRALAGAAVSIGCELSISDCLAYTPFLQNDALLQTAIETISSNFGNSSISHAYNSWSASCTDMADLSYLMPTVQINVNGAAGTAHGLDYRIADTELACVKSAQAQLLFLDALLSKNAQEARRNIELFTPAYTSASSFLAMRNHIDCEKKKLVSIDRGAVVLTLDS